MWISMETGKAGSSNSCFIENNSSKDINGWKIEFDANLDIYDYWCFTMKRTNRHYEFTNLSWNSLIKAGTSIEVGFNSNNDVTINSITNVKINGTAINFVLDVPDPEIDINADDDIIISGDSTLLSWNYSFINSYSINNGIGTVYDSCTTISPSVTTVYTITGTGPGGIVTDSVTVTVLPRVTVSITADSTEIIRGESTVLRWESENAEKLSLDDGTGAVIITGNSLSVTPGETTTYTIIADGESISARDSVTVTVRPRATVSITADSMEIIQGDSTVLRWESENVVKLSLDDGTGAVIIMGSSLSITPDETTTYTIIAEGEWTSARDNVTVTVRPRTTASITVDSPVITAGDSTILRWETQNADNVTLYNEEDVITITGNSLPISPSKTTIYTISAEGEWTSVEDSITVIVRPPVIVNITADSSVITSGDSTLLRWETQNANNVSLYNETGLITTTGNSLLLSPGETTTYTIYAEGEWEVAFNSITIIVEDVNLTDYLAYWPLEEAAAVILQDFSGNGFDGLYVVYPEWIEGTISDYALNFSSDNGYIIIENDSSFDTDIFTVSAWLTLNDLSPCDDIMAAYFKQVNKWHLKTSYNTLQFGYKDESGNEKTVNSGYLFTDTEWHHCVIVVNNTEKIVSFYVDGDKVAGPLAYDGFKVDYEFPWNLLIGQYDNEHQWNGAIDDVRFYARALNNLEIKALYSGNNYCR